MYSSLVNNWYSVKVAGYSQDLRKMASRLKLRKRKPPEQESATQSDLDNNNQRKLRINDENDIYDRALASAKKHNINLAAGRRDRGYGNCAFEAISMIEVASQKNSHKVPIGTECFG